MTVFRIVYSSYLATFLIRVSLFRLWIINFLPLLITINTKSQVFDLSFLFFFWFNQFRNNLMKLLNQKKERNFFWIFLSFSRFLASDFFLRNFEQKKTPSNRKIFRESGHDLDSEIGHLKKENWHKKKHPKKKKDFDIEKS